MPSNNLWKLSELDPPRYGYWRLGNATLLPFTAPIPTTLHRPTSTTTPGCGAVQNNKLRSPGYPNRYPRNISCVYRVHIPFNQELIVYFKYFELERGWNCRYDYLRISDDRNKTIGTYCGDQTGERVRVVATVAVLTFRSDSSVQYRGFELIFSFFPRGFTYFQNCSSGETDCHARLSSPLISSGAKWKCLQFWYYTAYAGQLKVLLVPNEATSHSLKTYNCCRSNGWRLQRVPLSANFAYKVVFEGSPRGFYGADSLVAVKNVVFLTDECTERPSRYNCSRNSSENDTSRYIYSPIYYYYYYDPLHDYNDYYYFRYGLYEGCNWTISAPYGNIIKLRFIEFQLEEHPSCSSDYIEVYDGYYGEFKLLGRYCGQRYPSFLKSSSNVLKILFSDKSRISVFKLFFSSEKREW
ncbi:PREDICTED: dorsal-ventral patterning protein tolloid-like isoform X1 [Acropora digitifera]|uniref:dorsal-ventral patterning protein tolloid-like isoform X1 n=1 Tax=Acropora digitifera TaxID=70779 RepID=UPI00077AD78B|nr:PREDICTED: dorsal-ventral patterning protein tolloid-like isoform X1 [Acropora digitifera]